MVEADSRDHFTGCGCRWGNKYARSASKATTGFPPDTSRGKISLAGGRTCLQQSPCASRSYLASSLLSAHSNAVISTSGASPTSSQIGFQLYSPASSDDASANPLHPGGVADRGYTNPGVHLQSCIQVVTIVTRSLYLRKAILVAKEPLIKWRTINRYA